MQIANEAASLPRNSGLKQKPSSSKLVKLEEQVYSDGITLQSKTTATDQNPRKPEKVQLSKEAHSLRIKEIHKRFRDKRRVTETPEKATERRAKAAEAARRKRRKAKEAALALADKQNSTGPGANGEIRMQLFTETAMYGNTVQQEFSKQPVVLSVEEKTEARRLKMREYNRRFREKRRAVETPEQTAARRAKLAEWMRMTRLIAKEKKLLATAQQCALIEASATAGQTMEMLPSISSEDHIQEYFCPDLSKRQNAAEQTVTKAIACKQEFDANSLGCSTSTWSSECSFSIKTESDAYPPAQQNHSQDSWPCYQGSESSFLTEDFQSTTNLQGPSWGKFKANDAVLPAVVPDEHSTYGAYIADRLYNANRNKSEVNVAQMLIESIMLNLLSGVYGYSINYVEPNEVGQIEEAPSLPTPHTNKPTVVKEEVDL